MLRCFFLIAFFSLLLFACGKHELEDDEYQVRSSSSRSSSSSIFSSSSSELPESSSSSEPQESSSSSEPESSSSIEPSSSSSDAAVDDCDFSETNYINSECFYNESVLLEKDVLLGSQARLHFADNASLSIKGELLKINSGAELYFGENSELFIDSWGILKISGEEGTPVVLAAETQNKLWKGIRTRSNADTINIEYADLSGALVGVDFGKDGVLKNSEIHDNEYGIKQNSSFGIGNLSGNNFYSNDYDAGVSLSVAATLGSPEQFAGKLNISNGDVKEKMTLPGFIYVMNNTMSVEDSLDIKPGAHFYFPGNSRVYVWSGGSLRAIGTAEKPIIFEGANDVFWGAGDKNAAFHFDGGCGDTSVLEHFEVLRAKTAFFTICQWSVVLSNGSIIDYRDRDFLIDGITPPFDTTAVVSNRYIAP